MKSLFALLLITTPAFAEVWPLDAVSPSLIVHGIAKPAAGVAGQSLVLNGDSIIELKDSSALAADGGFTSPCGSIRMRWRDRSR
ncbi:MAG: hypothetical protein R3F13_15105 [Prosthecobacter sp.]